MEDITDIVTGLTNKRIRELAYEIKGELEDFCAKHKCTGAAMNSFKVNFNGAGGGGALRQKLPYVRQPHRQDQLLPLCLFHAVRPAGEGAGPRRL